MSAQFEYLDPLIVACIRHRGKHAPDETNSTWEDLILYASPRRLLGRRFDVRGIGILWDDPRVWPPESRRYDVGIPVDPEDAPDIDAPAFLAVTMPAEYLKFTHVGPYDDIMTSYRQVLDVQLGIEDLELVSAPILELYRDSPAETPEDQLRTDLYFPVIKL